MESGTTSTKVLSINYQLPAISYQLPACQLERSRVTENVGGFTGGEIGEFRVLPQSTFAREPAFFEDVSGGPMVDMTQGIQAADPACPCDLDHGTQRLGREAPTPSILGQYIAGCCAIQRLECESRPTNQSAIVA